MLDRQHLDSPLEGSVAVERQIPGTTVGYNQLAKLLTDQSADEWMLREQLDS
jgi:hypothetical protein